MSRVSISITIAKSPFVWEIYLPTLGQRKWLIIVLLIRQFSRIFLSYLSFPVYRTLRRYGLSKTAKHLLYLVSFSKVTDGRGLIFHFQSFCWESQGPTVLQIFKILAFLLLSFILRQFAWLPEALRSWRPILYPSDLPSSCCLQRVSKMIFQALLHFSLSYNDSLDIVLTRIEYPSQRFTNMTVPCVIIGTFIE